MARDSKGPRRVSPENVRNNAASGGNKGYNFFNLPKGVREWHPEKAGKYPINFIGYEVKTKDHPDKKHDVTPGALWYKYPFVIFRKVGINEETIVSAASIGQPCPLMERRRKLSEDYDANKAEIDAMGMQRWVAFTIQDPDDEDKVAVYASSEGKLWRADAGLEVELSQTEAENLIFFDYKGGKTLTIRFSDAEFQGGKYIECTRIDFSDRKDMDQDKWLKKVPCLDEIFITLPYDTVKAMMAGMEEGGNDGGGETPRRQSTTPPGSASGKGGKKKEPEPEAEEEVETDFEVGQKVTGKDIKGKHVTGTLISIDGDEGVVKDDEDDEHDVELDDLLVVPDDDAEEAEPEDAPTPKKGKRIPKVGDKIKDDEGKIGTVTAVDVKGEDVTVKRPNGKEGPLDFSEIAEYLDDAEEETAEAPEFKVGDKVTWDNGDESGVITKILETEAKVKNTDGSGIERVSFDKLAFAKKGK